MGYVKWMDNNPKWLKVVLAIFSLGIFWGIYRIVKSAVEGNMLGVILGIVLLFVGVLVMWVDIVTLILMDKILWF